METRVEQFLHKLSNQNRSPGTLRVYAIALNRFFAWLNRAGLTESADSVEAFLKSLENLSAATQKLYFVALRSYYKFMKKYFILKIEYSFRRMIQNRERCYQPDDIRRIVRHFEDRTAARAGYGRKRDETWIKLSLLTGARPSELLGLDVSDIALSPHRIEIRIRNTKTKTDRIFPLALRTEDPKMKPVVMANAAVKNLLVSYLAARSEFMKRKKITDKDALFLSNKGNRLSYLQARKIFGQALGCLRLAGSPHYMRHTMITQKLVEGAPVAAVAALVGHASPYMTLKNYAHASEKLLEKVSYNNLFGDRQLSLM